MTLSRDRLIEQIADRLWALECGDSHCEWQRKYAAEHPEVGDPRPAAHADSARAILALIEHEYVIVPRPIDSEAIWRDPDRRGGRACLRGTSFTVTQMLAELADGHSLANLSKNFRLDRDVMAAALREIALSHEVAPPSLR